MKFIRYYEDEMAPIFERFGDGREFKTCEVPEIDRRRFKFYANKGFVVRVHAKSNCRAQVYRLPIELVERYSK